MLNCETNTGAMETRVRAAFRAWHGIRRGIEFQTDFEHGQWWVTLLRTGAQWSVNDSNRGFVFELVTAGDDA